MGRIVVQEFITLDGVVQAGGAPEEDLEGGFPHGGWSRGYDAKFDADDEGTKLVLDWESKTEALLLGRKTYEIWSRFWPLADENAQGLLGEFTRRYNRVPKYVASRTLTRLDWKNSHLLGEDVAAAAKKLRAERTGEIRIWGSANLIQTLGKHDLVDEYRLAVYPLVLGTGKKLFADGFALSRFLLANSHALKSGVVANTYQRRPE
jgi:dihydrofolate reductase